MRRQLDEAEEEISREKAHRRKVVVPSQYVQLFKVLLFCVRPSESSTTMSSRMRA